MSEQHHLVPKRIVEQWKEELRQERQVQPLMSLERAREAAASLRARLAMRRKAVMA